MASDLTTHGNFLQAVAEQAKTWRDLPPVERWNPPYCGEIDMAIRRDGSWTYMGTPIGRPALVRLFSTILRREEDGRYVLVTPAERVGIRVEDAPFLAVLLSVEGKGRDQVLRFTTNVADESAAGAEHPLRFVIDPETGGVASYVHVRARLEARLNRPVYYQLVELGLEEDKSIIPDTALHSIPPSLGEGARGRASSDNHPSTAEDPRRNPPLEREGTQEKAGPGKPMFGVWSGGVFFPMIASEALR